MAGKHYPVFKPSGPTHLVAILRPPIEAAPFQILTSGNPHRPLALVNHQLATLEFEKTELGQQDEFEREARLFAEEQLKTAQREASALKQQVRVCGNLVDALRA